MMKTDCENWPSIIRFFSPQIRSYNLRIFIAQFGFICFATLFYSRSLLRGDELDFTWRFGMLASIGLAILTLFQLGSFYWIQKYGSFEQIPSEVNKENFYITMSIFIVIPIALTVSSFYMKT